MLAVEAVSEGTSHLTEWLVVLTNLALFVITLILVVIGMHDARKHKQEALVEADRHTEEMLHDEGARDAAEMKRLAHIIEQVLEDERAKPTLKSAR